MGSLRELIEAKQRRTAQLPVLVGDPGALRAEMLAAQKALKEHEAAVAAGDSSEDLSAREQQIRKRIEDIGARQSGLVVLVDLQSLPDDQWEAMVGGIEPDEKGSVDLSPVLAPLLAASCVDADLQDADWWAEQLKRPEWTGGDKGAISQKLLELNIYAPSGAPEKVEA